MDVFVEIFAFILCYFVRIEAVPPAACFATFRWDDCGRPPVPVLYYWKPGSRCEVGLWRGCLPNLNMFQDEYECVATCIFSARAADEDYHKVNEIETSDINLDVTTVLSTEGNVTLTGDTKDGNVTGAVTGGTGGTHGTGVTKGEHLNSTGATGTAGEHAATTAAA